MTEPLLRPEDHAAWARWQIIALRHARTRQHLARVDRAKRIVEECLTRTPDAAVMWSGGKDSTAMTHLVCVEMGRRIPVFSEKDDLDYPGEREYVESLGRAWGLGLRILEPAVSPLEWLAQHRSEIVADGDFHSRSAGLSKAVFYGLVEQANAMHGAILLGLRSDESPGRGRNFASRGALYRRKNGQWTCCPLAEWSGLDVMAYMAARDVEPLPVYRCIAHEPRHRRAPWLVRKSWWIPGASSRMGGMAWLRHYWPSLYARARDLLPGAQWFS